MKNTKFIFLFLISLLLGIGNLTYGETKKASTALQELNEKLREITIPTYISEKKDQIVPDPVIAKTKIAVLDIESLLRDLETIVDQIKEPTEKQLPNSASRTLIKNYKLQIDRQIKIFKDNRETFLNAFSEASVTGIQFEQLHLLLNTILELDKEKNETSIAKLSSLLIESNYDPLIDAPH